MTYPAYPDQGPRTYERDPTQRREARLVHRVWPKPYHKTEDFVGRYLDMETGEDLTDLACDGALISIDAGDRQTFEVGPACPAREISFDAGDLVVMNLFNQDRGAGWRWREVPTGFDACRVICQTLTRDMQFLSLAIRIERPLLLKNYRWKPTEPRLRPTTIGKVELEDPVGVVVSRNIEWPVYRTVFVF